MSVLKQIRLNISGLNCANCAAKIEKKINEIDGVKEATVDFLNKKILLFSEEEDQNILVTSIQKIVDSVEDGVTVSHIDYNIYKQNK